MRRNIVLMIAALTLLPACLAFGQDKPVNIGRVFSTSPKPGMTKQYEEGRKRHMDFHRKQNDTWTWEVWQVETGPQTGSYLAVTFGHSYKDFDTWEEKMGAADTADGEINMSPYTAGGDNSFWMVMTDVSRMPAGNAMPKMAEVIHFMVKPGGGEDFEDGIKKINDAIVKTNWPSYYTWYSLIDGGESGHYVLLLNLNSFADLAGPDLPFPAMLEKAVGRHDSEALLHMLDKITQRQWSEIIKYRADLSYRPAGK